MSRAERHHNADLPLFGYRKPAEIILFPSCRRIDLVERIAGRMASLPPDRADSYFEIAMSALADKHRAAGIAKAQAAKDIAELRIAVLNMYDALAAEVAQ